MVLCGAPEGWNQCVCMAVVPPGITSHDILSYNISGILRALLENT